MSNNADASCPSSLDFDVKMLGEDKKVNLCDEYLGKVILVVNTASKCGFTPQYEGLEKLYKEKKDQGFVVLGFPSHDFYQEPESVNYFKHSVYKFFEENLSLDYENDYERILNIALDDRNEKHI